MEDGKIIIKAHKLQNLTQRQIKKKRNKYSINYNSLFNKTKKMKEMDKQKYFQYMRNKNKKMQNMDKLEKKKKKMDKLEKTNDKNIQKVFVWIMFIIIDHNLLSDVPETKSLT